MAARLTRSSGLQNFIVLILCFINLSYTEGFHLDPRNEFYDHAIIYPTLYSETRGKREIRSATQVQYEDKVTVGFIAFNKNFIVDLYMNKDLLPVHYFEKYHEDGKGVINRPMKTERNHCHYQGHVKGLNHSWAAISTCNGLSGVIYDGEDLHYIEPNHSSGNHSHLLFKVSDMIPKNLTCGVDFCNPLSKTYISSKELPRHRRSTAIYPPYKSNSKSRFVEMIIVNDNKEYKKFNQSKKFIFERSKQIANIVSGLYSPLNIFIALVGVIVWSDYDEIKLSTDGDVTLTNFLYYRQERLALEHPNDNAQLITAITFDGGVVGKALKGPICTYEYSGGVNMDHSDLVGLVATTVAHELGHNFGMEHDTDECKCRDERCIMSPSSSSTIPRHWSSCSLEYLDHAYSHGMDYCLRNRPKEIIGPVCGNGFLEDGEECDCGLKEFCDNHCCNATSCHLFSNSSCAMGGCCDIKTCQVKRIATPCREAVSECDLPEYCDGKSEFCPLDTMQQDGVECADGKAYCYNGKCSSHADQCKLLWGQTGKMSDVRCYEQNFKGNVNGNCGYNRLNQTYKACGKQDTLCGMLHCTHLNEKLEFGMESAAILAKSYITVKGKIFTCRSAIVDLGIHNADPGLTPNGAKCGNKMACVNQKCVPVDSIKGSNCPNQCNGNGVCNNKGNCHCLHGYGPPFCNSPGSGGSIDSGPASDPGGYVLVVIMYVIFLGVIPLMVIGISIMYYFRPHFKTWWITKARKANIKCRAKHTIQRKPQPPSKFNFDRNSLRTLEISSPIQQFSPSPQNLVDSGNLICSGEFNSLPIGKTTYVKTETSNSMLHNIPITNLQTSKPIPVRPAPPRPDSVQHSHSWKIPVTSTTSVVRTSSLRVTSENGRPISMLTSRPNCPPPRPPLPKPIPQPLSQPSLSNEDPNKRINERHRSGSPNSAFYNDCKTLDFSDTPLAFVHQSKTCGDFIHEHNHQMSKFEPNKLHETKLANRTYPSIRTNNCTNETNLLHSNTKRSQASVVASLTQKFENQKKIPPTGTNPCSVRPSVKLKPLPSSLRNNRA